MELVADTISVAGTYAPLLQTTSFVAPPARVTVVAGDPGYGHVALALALGGRIQLWTGQVLLDGIEDVAAQREHVSLVDVPDVSAPEDGLAVREVVAEELAFAGRASRGRDVQEFLAAQGVPGHGHERFEELTTAERVRVLTGAAALRAQTRVLVLAHPDRRGGDPHEWWPSVEGLAADGLTVIVQLMPPTVRQLGLPLHYELGVRA